MTSGYELIQSLDIHPGQSYHLYYNQDNPNNCTLHIRGIVDDQIVMRKWSRHKQRWVYLVEDPIWFSICRERLTRV